MEPGRPRTARRLERERVPVAPPEVAAVRRSALRAGIVFVVAGALLAVLIPLTALAMPGGGGAVDAITVAGGCASGALVLLGGLVLLGLRQAVDGHSLLAARARTARRHLLVLLALSTGVTALCAYGAAGIDDEPTSAALAAPLTGTILVALANVVLRSLLTDRGAAPGRSAD